MTDNVSLAVFDPLKAAIVELQVKDEKLVFDHSTPGGEKELRSYVRRLRSYKADIAATHKRAKAGILDIGRKLDGMKNELTEGVQQIIVTRMKPLDDIAEAKQAEAEAERLEAERIETLRIVAMEKKEAELAAKEDVLVREQERLEAAKQAEVDKTAAVKAAQEQAERDNKWAAEQAERFRLATIAKAEQDKKDAAANAERDKQAAIDTERARVARIEAARQAEKDRLAEVERKRVENEDHRTMIEVETYSYLKEIIPDVQTGYRVMEALRDGNIPNVTLNY